MCEPSTYSFFTLCMKMGRLTVEDEIEFLLTLSGRCEKHAVADGLLYPIDEAVDLPLDGQVLLGVCSADGRFPTQDTHRADGLAGD